MIEDLDIPVGATIVHPPYGFVKVVDWAGDELSIVNAARTSYAKRSEWAEITEDGVHDLSDADAGLINFLLKGKHGTPFEMVWMKFHVAAPIFVFREWVRHRIASLNEVSGRYVELKPRFYLPDDEHVRVQVGKPGHYTYEPKGSECVSDEPCAISYGKFTRRELKAAYEFSYERYEELLGRGIAKEIARACLPVAIYSEMYWATNLRGLLNFLSLRNHPRALQEIRDYAAVMESELAKRMPIVHAAFLANDRVAP